MRGGTLRCRQKRRLLQADPGTLDLNQIEAILDHIFAGACAKLAAGPTLD